MNPASIFCYRLLAQNFLIVIFLVQGTCACAQHKSDTISDWIPEMVFIAGGTFQMGSRTGGSDKRPVHSVVLKDFYIGKYEVTQAQWKKVMGEDDHNNYFEGCPDCPVERVSWYNAVAFTEKLSLLTGEHYRLPTEAEWEFAARGGIQSGSFRYSGSDSVPAVAWRPDNSANMTHPVGMKKPNEAGTYDMSGNVWEWCSDWYSDSYYSVSPQKNPAGPGSGSQKVIRGGSWFQDSFGLNITDRKAMNAEWRLGFVGFRVCK